MIPRLSTINPGNASQAAKKYRLNMIVVGMTIGRTVVVMFMVTVAPLVLCKATELCGLKLHCVPVGAFAHDKVMFCTYSGCGVN